MFNLQPGQGLGFGSYKDLAFGLWNLDGTVIVVPETPDEPISLGRWVTGWERRTYRKKEKKELTVYDNILARGKDDDDVIAILMQLLAVMDDE